MPDVHSSPRQGTVSSLAGLSRGSRRMSSIVRFSKSYVEGFSVSRMWQLRALTIIWTFDAGLQVELFDSRGDEADDPGQTAGADDRFGLGAMGDDSLDGAGDLVAGGEAVDGVSREQDIIGLDRDEHAAVDRPVEEPDDQLGAVLEPEAAGALVGGMALDPSGEDVAEAFERDRSRREPPGRAQDVERWSFGGDSPVFQQEQSGAQRDGLGRAVGDIQHGDRLGTLDDAETLEDRVAVGQVESGDRLVAEQEPGPGRQCPRQADALTLAAGECRR